MQDFFFYDNFTRGETLHVPGTTRRLYILVTCFENRDAFQFSVSSRCQHLNQSANMHPHNADMGTVLLTKEKGNAVTPPPASTHTHCIYLLGLACVIA
jgi:hypothetical protein